MFHTIFRVTTMALKIARNELCSTSLLKLARRALASQRQGLALDLVEGTPETFAGDGMSSGVSSRSTDLSSPPPWERPATVHDSGGEENMRLLELSNTG